MTNNHHSYVHSYEEILNLESTSLLIEAVHNVIDEFSPTTDEKTLKMINDVTYLLTLYQQEKDRTISRLKRWIEPNESSEGV